MVPRRGLIVLLWALASLGARAQVIEFESNGLKYQTLSKAGLTVMFAHLPAHLRDYTIVQVAISNGSNIVTTVRPEDFSFRRKDGAVLRAEPARAVINRLIARGSRSDVIKLVSAYETTLYGIPRFESTNGYEQRREAFLAEVSSTRLKAAAAASAIALVDTKLTAGQSTDGAVFFPSNKELGPGQLIANLAGESFEFENEPDLTKTLKQR